MGGVSPYFTKRIEEGEDLKMLMLISDWLGSAHSYRIPFTPDHLYKPFSNQSEFGFAILRTLGRGKLANRHDVR